MMIVVMTAVVLVVTTAMMVVGMVLVGMGMIRWGGNDDGDNNGNGGGDIIPRLAEILELHRTKEGQKYSSKEELHKTQYFILHLSYSSSNTPEDEETRLERGKDAESGREQPRGWVRSSSVVALGPNAGPRPGVAPGPTGAFPGLTRTPWNQTLGEKFLKRALNENSHGMSASLLSGFRSSPPPSQSSPWTPLPQAQVHTG